MANELKKYFFGQGRLNLVTRDALGNMGKAVFVGDAESAEVAMTVDFIDNKESFSSFNALNVHHALTKGGEITINAKSFDLDNLALGLYATKATVAGASVTGEVLPAGLEVGDEVFLDNPKASAIVITDGAGSPATLVANTDYIVLDADTGRIKILNLGSYVQPFEAAYTYGSRKELSLFTTQPPERWLRYEGINILTGTKVLLDLFRVSLDPMGNLPLISGGNSVGQFAMKGKLLIDETKAANGALGQFGSWKDLA